MISSKFPPYYIMFRQDIILPVDNLLRFRRIYAGEELYKIIIEQQHKLFVQATSRICRDEMKRNQKKSVRDPMFYKAHETKEDKPEIEILL